MAGFSDEEILIFGLEDCPDERVMDFISQELITRVLRPHLNGSQRHVLADKWATQALLASIGVPVPKLYGLYHPQVGMTAAGEPLTTPEEFAELIRGELPCRLFLKPRGGRQGHEVRAVDAAPDADGIPCAKTAAGTQTLAAFLDALPMEAADGQDRSCEGYLVQGFIDQHPAVAAFNPGSVNTVRIITFRGLTGEVTIDAAFLRTGRAGAQMDNWSQGGLVADVDLATGAVTRAFGSLKHEAPRRVATHPDSGVAFEGFVLPDWPRALEACRKAARVFSGVRWVGWDVAMTPAGPVIVEGNSDWSIATQLVNGAYLGPGRRAELEREVALPDRLPSLPRAFARVARREFRRGRRWVLRG
ncbi:MAG TPA: sugar-transfer associated ATP-grasp domain-containing protein [Amaricoccus sp.]|uniref:sugar-transfer associated ATP-grasp domain-containing protein n=1 Tax=Amaricoccus sp. TaxID=1872485 RepID=UPI002C4343FE|nr:sugar-transfer associated ATP-grasp domain-containing protein [Amaricoccus sp.]HMQ92408.1 sugar-transfer associated ATP-grasp domain-containing protein [Amaricoccus sp.]HMR53143.1 sugar-transfer associated ATP-grasp domain-containing protein [Amaricoccus sp.]HMR59420.1 sugar-transfer associated ATP-grasp domain-containing protein [Amaricoccus sp.]HMU00003.1 sugar-transfer associated ATP-grasp domain-containing protein [Amaricoccus sp.]